ncbi:MAG: hypothetical protein ABIZ81_09695 [Opitutaceae bacterium]
MPVSRSQTGALACDLRAAIVSHMSIAAESDHERAAHAHQVAIYRAMSPQQRLQLALRMNRNMRQLMAVGFRDRNPTWTEMQVQRAVADRILYASTG